MFHFKNILGKVMNTNKYSTLIPWAIQNEFKSHDLIKADGCYLYTKHQNTTKKIMDFTSGLMVVNLGHNNKYIMNGFMEHHRTGIAYTNSEFKTDQREYLSDRLINITNNAGGKVFYTNGGADANETAMFIVHEYQKLMSDKKKAILSFRESFHGGSTIAASLLTGDGRRNQKELHYSLNLQPIMNNPSLCDNGASSINQISDLFDNGDVAGIIIEGSSGSARCISYPDGYFKQLETLCIKNNILIICDEIMSGWGRTGSLFGYTKSGISPDIITTSKAFTSGYIPMGGVIVSKKVAEIFNNKLFAHGLTYFAHPLACNIANKCLDLYLEDDQKIIKQTKRKGNLLSVLGKKIEEDVDIVKEYRNNGLLGCFELNTNDSTLLSKISTNLFNNGVYCFKRENRLFTAPPLIVTDDEIHDTMEIISRTLSHIQN
jgi:taurine---2-oxoglutarate transaminase